VCVYLCVSELASHCRNNIDFKWLSSLNLQMYFYCKNVKKICFSCATIL